MGVSDALGAKSVETGPGDKEFKRALFEKRGTVSHGGNVWPATAVLPVTDWLSFAMKIFDEARQRAADTPDDPTTPKVNESSRIELID